MHAPPPPPHSPSTGLAELPLVRVLDRAGARPSEAGPRRWSMFSIAKQGKQKRGMANDWETGKGMPTTKERGIRRNGMAHTHTHTHHTTQPGQAKRSRIDASKTCSREILLPKEKTPAIKSQIAKRITCYDVKPRQEFLPSTCRPVAILFTSNAGQVTERVRSVVSSIK